MASLFEDHLSLDAVVAFADGEMGLIAFQRAAAHLARCQACAEEVAEQTSARQQLRAARCPSIPVGLLDALRSIPVALPAPRPEQDGHSPDGASGGMGGPTHGQGLLGSLPRALRGKGFHFGG